MKSLINLEDITHIEPVNNKKLHVEWFIGKRCNYSCTYCHDMNHDNYSNHVDVEHIIKSIGIMLDKFDNNININFTGGEPTIHPKFSTLCSYLKSNNVKVSMTTNGSRTGDFYVDAYNTFSHITFSHHFEHAINDTFLSKMKYIHDNMNAKKGMVVQVMYHAQYETEVTEAIDFLRFHDIPHTVRRIRPTINSDNPIQHALEYTEEQLSVIQEYQTENTGAPPNVKVTCDNVEHEIHTNELTGLGPMSFEGWLCWAGVNYVRIHENKAYRCWGEWGNPIGDITEPDFALLDNPRPCVATKCVCLPEISSKKIKPELIQINNLI